MPVDPPITRTFMVPIEISYLGTLQRDEQSQPVPQNSAK
jgi:hypothetical protein